MLKYFKKLLLILLFFILNNPLIGYSDHKPEEDDCYYKTVIVEQKLLHTVTVNPNKYKIINALAKVTGKNVDFVSHIARKYHALIAINGGFFREVEPTFFVPAGPLKVAGTWHGIAYQPRAAIGWKSNGNLTLIDRLKTKTLVQIGDLNLPVYYFNPQVDPKLNNRQNLKAKAALYSSIHPEFTHLNIDYPNILIKQNDESAYVYQQNESIDGLESAKVSVEIFPQIGSEEYLLWQTVDFITSGAPILIRNHDVLSNYTQEKISSSFVNSQHARSAICVLENGFWKFVVTSNMTIPELANAMQFLQCKDAINLDGGSSSSMYLSSKIGGFNLEFTSITNPVTDAILVLEKDSGGEI